MHRTSIPIFSALFTISEGDEIESGNLRKLTLVSPE
jgi:hypothetical protein